MTYTTSSDKPARQITKNKNEPTSHKNKVATLSQDGDLLGS